MTDLTQTWSDKELDPYLPKNRPHVPLIIMTGHLFHRELDADYPATLSHNIITKLLREELQWDGVVASDDMHMQALTSHYTRRESIHRAILAGVDLLVMGNNLTFEEDAGRIMHEDIMSLVREGRVSVERIRQSYTRIMRLKERIGLVHAGTW